MSGGSVRAPVVRTFGSKKESRFIEVRKHLADGNRTLRLALWRVFLWSPFHPTSPRAIPMLAKPQ